MEIRGATLADLRAAEVVRIETWKIAYRGLVPDEHLDGLEVTHDRIAWLEERFSEGDTSTFVAVDNGSVVGMAVAGECRDDDRSGEQELYALYVLPSWWGSGAGQALWDAALPFTSLWVLADNPRARAFYERNGFHAEAAKTIDVGAPLTEVRYISQL